MRKLKSILVATAAAVSVVALAPSAQADVKEGWGMSYGATHTESTINWSSGYSAHVKGFIKAVSGYREVCFRGENGSLATGWICKHSTNGTYNWGYDQGHLALETRGGVQVIRAVLGTDSEWVRGVHCTRNGCSRDF